jgi:hypothetical protein
MKRYRPWVKGPAIIIPFPRPVSRCWVVEPVAGGWQGRTVGISEPADAVTEVGELRLVMHALSARCNRRGLPIVVASEPGSREVAA